MINETQEYDNHLDFSNEPESVDLDYVEEYPDILDFDETDDDIWRLKTLLRMKHQRRW